MRKVCAVIIAFVFCLMFTSCENEEPEYEISPVIEGYIDSDGYPNVLFTASFVDDDTETIADKLVRWGKISISDGERTVILTGGPDDRQFPPFRYVSHDIEGVPGRRYTIEAEYKSFHATASCVMPQPPEVVGVDDKFAAESDTLRDVTLSIRAPQDVPAFYHVSVCVVEDGKSSSYLPAMLGCVRADVAGGVVSLPVYRAKTSLNAKQYDSLRLPSDSYINIKVERVTREIYDFWMNFNNANLFGGSIFISTNTPVGGNVVGGYGYFSAQGVEVVKLAPLR